MQPETIRFIAIAAGYGLSIVVGFIMLKNFLNEFFDKLENK